MAARNGFSNLHWGRGLMAACLLSSLVLGCQPTASAPQTDPNALKREAEKLKKEHDRETHNR